MDVPRTVVLIDDDELIQLSWKIYCRVRKVKFMCFASMDAALSSPLLVSLSRGPETWIVVDSDLGIHVPRGEVSSRAMSELGFTRIWIATGHLAQDIRVSDWICGVRGKEPWF